MNKAKLILLCIAAGLVLVGGCLVCFALWRGVGTGGKYFVEETCDLPKGFQSIVLDCDDCNLRIQRGRAGEGSVSYKGDSRKAPKLEVRDGVLHIDSSIDGRRPWYEYFSMVSFGGNSLTVSLPGDAYDSLTITHTSGSTQLDEGFVFGTVELRSVSGSVELSADVSHGLSVYSTSGSVALQNVRCGLLTVESTSGAVSLTDAVVSGYVRIEHTSGNTNLENVSCGSLDIESQSGGVRLDNTLAAKTVKIQNTSGNISLENCDAAALDLETTSGAVRGSLRTAKIFQASANSGSVHVPDTATGGLCRVHTTSGNIHLEIAD